MAIVNGFNTEKIRMQLQRDNRYLIYGEVKDYYIVDPAMILHCNYDVIEKFQSVIGMVLPENGYGYKYSRKGGWEPDDFNNLNTYLEICNKGHYSYGDNKIMNVKSIKQVKCGFDKLYGVYGKKHHDCILYTLENDDKVLLNKRYTDMMAHSKKWNWFAEGMDRLSALHFMNRENNFEMWVLPIRYKEGSFEND